VKTKLQITVLKFITISPDLLVIIVYSIFSGHYAAEFSLALNALQFCL